MATRGLMADNMFLGKSALLSWLNNTLDLRLEKIEDVSCTNHVVPTSLLHPPQDHSAPPPPPACLQTCSGAVACQLMDVLHPGSVNLKRVDFNVRNEYEFVTNYKELQQAFAKVGVDRAFNVSQLSKGKRQDNNEFMQWFKGYWDSITGGQDVAADYNAVARRNVCKTGDWKKFSLVDGPSRAPSSAGAEGTIPAVRRGGAPASAPRSVGARPPLSKVTPQPNPQLSAKMADLSDLVTELKLKVETAERERDFYFDKLRDIEILCQAPELADIPVSLPPV